MKELFRGLLIVYIGRLESLLFEKHVVKAGQDHTGNGNDITGGGFRDAGDVGSKLDQIIIGGGELCDGVVQPVDDGIKIGRMLPTELNFESLVIGMFYSGSKS